MNLLSLWRNGEPIKGGMSGGFQNNGPLLPWFFFDGDPGHEENLNNLYEAVNPNPYTIHIVGVKK